jgi:(2Fe-2S) ferredoxin
MDVAGRLRLAIIRQGLDAEILINNCGTIDLCDIGPNIVVYPDNIIYRGVTVKDIPEVVEYLKGGPVIERLLLSENSDEERTRRTFYLEAIAEGDSLSLERGASLARSRGLDEAWIAGQISRGFMSKKPDADSGKEVLRVTRKSRVRYGL